jgi:hypothetical protein
VQPELELDELVLDELVLDVVLLLDVELAAAAPPAP